MPSFSDSIVLFILALLLFGPKKLPVLARELGKWIGEFRRASNEFKYQMEEELRASEQAERQKQIAAMEAAAPLPPALNEPPEPEHPHLARHVAAFEPATVEPTPAFAADIAPPDRHTSITAESPLTPAPAERSAPLPIASHGQLHMMPPATGLPTPRARNGNALGSLLDSIPADTISAHTNGNSHGD